MRTISAVLACFVIAVIVCCPAAAQSKVTPQLKLNSQEYLEMPGLNVMAFQDIYPEGHQGGISIIQNGERVATNGDLRLDRTPGQWQPLPKLVKRIVDTKANEIVTSLVFPDPDRNKKGFNPIDYPDLNLSYRVRVRGEGQSIRIIVDLDQPLPQALDGKIAFNLELYPTSLFGRAWYLGDKSGIFPRQANGPDAVIDGRLEAVPIATGRRLSVAPESDEQRLVIESRSGHLQLLDARNKHNNGWFVVRAAVPAGVSTGAVNWVVTPHAIPGWKSEPVVHVSQVGYHPNQKKIAVIELDQGDVAKDTATLKRISEQGGTETVLSAVPRTWGKFLRYNYLQFDFTKVANPGMYVLEYRGRRTQPFRIANDVYERGVWQPVLEYFLPIQMCHMKVEEQYRVWHGACHLDDARMAPVNHTHFDGYSQGASTLTTFQPGETVPGLNVGGWHDAGDDDLRIESQADEVRILASAYEEFGLDYDDTTIDGQNHSVKIHKPDGKPDVLQQVEHGVLSILGSYKSMGRFYRGIISSSIEQYVMTGDTSNATDNLFFDGALKPRERTVTHSSEPDDRWVFTEDNPGHEYKGIAALAIAGRVLKQYNPALAAESVQAAETMWKLERDPAKGFDDRIAAAAELLLTTNKPEYARFIVDNREQVLNRIDSVGWSVGRVLAKISDPAFAKDVRAAVSASFARVAADQAATPFGVPYKPHIWGAGWEIQSFGVKQYYLHRAFPDIVTSDYMLNALNFVLGVHPGSNTASFASGVGARSMTIAYGFNRGDWSYIPGGVVSGTALIRPDFPEMKDFPYLWQQSEYVMGGGSSNYMFLVLAADQILNQR